MTKYERDANLQTIRNLISLEPEIISKSDVPDTGKLKVDEGVFTEVGAVFVDIRKSTEFISNNNSIDVARVFRVFINQTLEMLASGEIVDVGIRGDCVYGIYAVHDKPTKYELLNKAVQINTLMELLNREYKKHKLPTIEVGIGIAASSAYVVKVGNKAACKSDRIWIGDAVVSASNLSKGGSKIVNHKKNPAIIIDCGLYNTIKKMCVHTNKTLAESMCEFEKHFGTDWKDPDFMKWIESKSR